jgi:hypothetical protein
LNILRARGHFFLRFAQTHSATAAIAYTALPFDFPFRIFGGLCECIAVENARMRVGALVCAVLAAVYFGQIHNVI